MISQLAPMSRNDSPKSVHDMALERGPTALWHKIPSNCQRCLHGINVLNASMQLAVLPIDARTCNVLVELVL